MLADKCANKLKKRNTQNYIKKKTSQMRAPQICSLSVRQTSKSERTGDQNHSKRKRVASKENKGEIKKVLHPSNFL
jgi:hypothetical protein